MQYIALLGNAGYSASHNYYVMIYFYILYICNIRKTRKFFQKTTDNFHEKLPGKKREFYFGKVVGTLGTVIG